MLITCIVHCTQLSSMKEVASSVRCYNQTKHQQLPSNIQHHCHDVIFTPMPPSSQSSRVIFELHFELRSSHIQPIDLGHFFSWNLSPVNHIQSIEPSHFLSRILSWVNHIQSLDLSPTFHQAHHIKPLPLNRVDCFCLHIGGHLLFSSCVDQMVSCMISELSWHPLPVHMSAIMYTCRYTWHLLSWISHLFLKPLLITHH
jgi:hypothetical protein